MLSLTRWTRRDLTDKDTTRQHPTEVSRAGLVAVTRSDTVQRWQDMSIQMRKV